MDAGPLRNGLYRFKYGIRGMTETLQKFLIFRIFILCLWDFRNPQELNMLPIIQA
jgi:hypothetical protein